MIGAPFRVDPAMPAAAYKTYGFVAPTETHTRPAACAEVECAAHLNGWSSTFLDGSDDLEFARKVCRGDVDGVRRVFTEHDLDGWTQLVFQPGQTCFAVSTHRVPLERPPIFLVRSGDWRGDPYGGEPRIHRRPEDWVEDFAEHQQQLADTITKG